MDKQFVILVMTQVGAIAVAEPKVALTRGTRFLLGLNIPKGMTCEITDMPVTASKHVVEPHEFGTMQVVDADGHAFSGKKATPPTPYEMHGTATVQIVATFCVDGNPVFQICREIEPLD